MTTLELQDAGIGDEPGAVPPGQPYQVGALPADVAAVDLHEVGVGHHRELVRFRGEVVDGDDDADRAQLLADLHGRGGVLEEHLLGQLQPEGGRRQAPLLQLRQDQLGETGLQDVPGRQVDGDRHRAARGMPAGRLVQGPRRPGRWPQPPAGSARRSRGCRCARTG